jgi:very-short-patch-repair endonuclease
MNAVACGFEVDALWDEQKLIVELDSYAWHSDRAAFERDRIRDATLQLEGYIVLRITYRRLKHETAAVVELIRRGLGA